MERKEYEMNIKDILKQNDEALTEAKEYSPQFSILWGPAARAWCVDPLDKEKVDVIITQAIVDSCEKELNITQNTKDLAEFARDALFIIEEMLHGLCDDYQLKQFKKKWGLE